MDISNRNIFVYKFIKVDAQTLQLKYDKIKELKAQWNVAKLCRRQPKEIEAFFYYIRTLRYHDKPNYKYMKGLFRNLR